MRKRLTILVLLALAGGGLGFWYSRQASAGASNYLTETVHRGNLLATVSATGTVEPEDTIDVGAQVAGQILSFGKDKQGKTFDYGSSVEEGDVLAQIDDTLFRARVAASRAHLDSAQRKVEQAKAKVGSAKANVARGEADLKLQKAKQVQAGRDWVRAQQLGPRGSLSPQEYDAFQAAADSAKASVGVSEAALFQYKAALADAEAAVKDAEATAAEAAAVLEQDEINLGYTTVKSPIKGTIIDRRVTLGQTVQSSFNTPSLFLLARDLRRVKVWVSVNEADIGQIKVGQQVTFTVDSHPHDVFKGVVDRIRLNATMNQNVVTYTVEVLTDNPTTADYPNGKLYPYMTANVRFEVGRRSDALLVPNSALRWRPRAEQVAPEFRQQFIAGKRKRDNRTEQTGMPTARDHTRGTVWVEDGGFVKPVRLKLGLSDGTCTEVAGGELADGQAVVTGEQQKGATEKVNNPFTAQPFGKKS